MVERLKKEVKRWGPSVALFGIAGVLLLNKHYVWGAILGGAGFLFRPKKESGAHTSYETSHSLEQPLTGRNRVFTSASARYGAIEG
jgi:hypothetical protein